MLSCVYCTNKFQESRVGDHVIPASWGEFDGAEQFHRLCPRCHAEIDKGVEQLVRCGPEAWVAKQLGLQFLRKRRSGSKASLAAHGAKPPKLTALMRGAHLPVRHSDVAQAVEPVDCVILTDAADAEHTVELRPEMSARSILKVLRTTGAQPITKARLSCQHDQYSAYIEKMRAYWPSLRSVELPSIEAGQRRVRVSILFNVTDLYFRVIAKIAFHYFLTTRPTPVSGDEPEFDAVRSFIRDGGAVDRFVHSGPQIDQCFSAPTPPTDWGHVVAVNERADGIGVMLHLFDGPGTLTRPYLVDLSREHRIQLPGGQVWGDRFTYRRTRGQARRFLGVRLPIDVSAIPAGFVTVLPRLLVPRPRSSRIVQVKTRIIRPRFEWPE